MSAGAQQLKKDFEEIGKLLESYPDIKIVNTEGDPPELYDIEYTIKGYKTNPDGTPSPENRHLVRITLPFGYPHFPPTAKPLTAIFHPDIDPDAIRIADFWKKNHSLADLIIHIGQMICGHHYTKEEPFNQTAYDWFEERSSWLPFDVLEPREDEDEPASEAGGEKEEAFTPATDLDILKDDLDFPFDEDDESEAGSEDLDFAITEDTSEVDLIFTEEDEQVDDLLFETADGEEEDLDFSLEPDEAGEEVSLDLDDEAEQPAALADAEEEDFEFSLEPDEAGEEVSLDLADDTEQPAALADAEEEDFEFSLEPDEAGEEVSFDLSDETEQPAAPADAEDSLFDLETGEDSARSPEDFFPDQASDDFASAFAEEPANEQEQSEELDITLDDLGDLEEEILVPDAEDDSFIVSDSGAADLSALEGEEEPDFVGLEDEDTIDLSGLEPETGETKEESPAQIEDTASDEDILSALSLDEEFSSAQKADDQAQIIQTLIEQKQIFSAKKLFNDLPDPATLPNHKQLELTIQDAVGEAEDLYKKADLHEQKGEFEKAGILLDLVANIAADYPALDFARNRIRESLMDSGKEEASSASESEKSDQAAGEDESAGKKTRRQKKKKAGRQGLKIPGRLIALVVLLLLAAGIGGGGYYVYENDAALAHEAAVAVKQAEQMVDRKEFKNAQKELETARTVLDKITFFQGGEKEELIHRINTIAGSDFFKEGLNGRVLFGDTYVSVETARAIDKFTTHKGSAEQALAKGQIDKAISAYEESLPYAEQAGFTEEVAAISRQIKELQLQKILEQARQAEEGEDWQTAVNAYQKAAEFSKTVSTPAVQQNIALRLATASYRYHLQGGLEAISNSRWQEAATALQLVLTILEENPQLVPASKETEIKRMLLESQLYSRLAEARKAYESRKWQEAISLYKDAVTLLRDNSKLFGEDATENISKIEKTILTTRVAEEQFYVAAAQSRKELEKAVHHYEAIAALIKDSPYRDDPAFAKILDDAQTRAGELKNELLINEKKDWLLANYDQIFRQAYPSAKMSDLMNPKVRFIKRDGDILIFNLSCSERKQGRMFRLELNYQHDLKKNDWGIYTEKIEES